MALDFPCIRRQRKLGAFPTADAMRAAKAAALAAESVPPVVEMPVAKPLKVSSPNQTHDDPTDK
jgi:hypothetical protein